MSRYRLALVAVFAVTGACLLPLGGASGQDPGSAKITAVLLSVTHRTQPDAPWIQSKVGTPLTPGNSVRTGRRSKCQITFPDGSFVRMGERSDLVITDLVGRRIRLRSGRLYVKIVSGTATVEGYTAVAAVKGTIFEFIGPEEIPPPGVRPMESVRVWSGSVDVTIGGRTTTAGSGTEITGLPDGRTMEKNTPSRNYPGGSYSNWFGGEWSSGEVTVTPNSSAGSEQKIEHTTQQQVSTLPGREARRQASMVHFGLVDVVIASQPTRASTTPPRTGGTQMGAVPVGALVAATNALTGQNVPEMRAWEKRFFGPTTKSTPFAFLGGEESVYGARAVSSAVYRNSYVRVAANVTDQFDGDLDFEMDEAFISQRNTRTEWTVGRQRFLNGPVNNSEIGTLHDFGRVTGVRWRGLTRSGPKLDVAYLGRATTYPGAAGEAVYARAAQSVGPAVVGANMLWLFNEGPGHSVDFAISPLPRRLDLYAELGEDPTGRDLHTIGLYFPKLYQSADVDVFVEQAKRQGFPSVFSVVAYKKITDTGTAVFLLEKPSGASWSVGAGYATQLGSG